MTLEGLVDDDVPGRDEGGHMRFVRAKLPIVLASIAAATLFGCRGDEGERTGQAIDKAVQGAKDATGQAGTSAKTAAGNAVEAAKDAARDAAAATPVPR